MSEPLQRWWFFHGAAVDPSDVHKYEGMEFGPYVLAAEAEAHEAAAVAEARAEGYEDGCIHGASKYPAIYEQGQRDERNRIGRALEQATYPRGGLLKVEVLNLIYPQDDSRYTTVHGGVQVPDTTPHPDDHPAAGCVHCQDLAADADDLGERELRLARLLADGGAVSWFRRKTERPLTAGPRSVEEMTRNEMLARLMVLNGIAASGPMTVRQALLAAAVLGLDIDVLAEGTAGPRSVEEMTRNEMLARLMVLNGIAASGPMTVRQALLAAAVLGLDIDVLAEGTGADLHDALTVRVGEMGRRLEVTS